MSMVDPLHLRADGGILPSHSKLDTKAVYERVHMILDSDDLAYGLSRLMDEVREIYRFDTEPRGGES